MKEMFLAGRMLAYDLASTVVFLVSLMLTKNLLLSVAVASAVGIAQFGWQAVRRKPIDTMQWMSLFLVLGSGAATFLTRDARFIMVKPSVIYVIIGVVMLKRGWMNRYLPPIALETAGDLAIVFGYVWSGLMFASAALNLALAFSLDPLMWAKVMSVWGMASKLALFFIQYGTMRTLGGRRRRAQLAGAAAAGGAAA